MRIAVIAFVGAALWAQEPKAGCPCPDLGADRGSGALLTIDGAGGKPELVVCGHLESRGTGGSIVATEFSVLQCRSDEPLVEFDGLRRAEITSEPGRLLVTEVAQWPFGPDWKWIDVPLSKFVIRTGTPPEITRRIVLDPPALTAVQIKEVLNDFESLRKSKVGEDDRANMGNLVGRLLGAALTGDAAAIDAFQAMQKWLDSLEPFSTECAALYDDAREVYRLYTESKGAPRGSQNAGDRRDAAKDGGGAPTH